MGVAVASLAELREKAGEKFSLAIRGEGIRIFLPDGTEVEDEEYFRSLPVQSHLIAAEDQGLQVAGMRGIPFPSSLWYSAIRIANMLSTEAAFDLWRNQRGNLDRARDKEHF